MKNWNLSFRCFGYKTSAPRSYRHSPPKKNILQVITAGSHLQTFKSIYDLSFFSFFARHTDHLRLYLKSTLSGWHCDFWLLHDFRWLLCGGKYMFIVSLSTGCSLNIKMLWFFLTLPVLIQRWCSTCLVCVLTLTPRQNSERQESWIF